MRSPLAAALCSASLLLMVFGLLAPARAQELAWLGGAFRFAVMVGCAALSCPTISVPLIPGLIYDLIILRQERNDLVLIRFPVILLVGVHNREPRFL